MKKLILLVSIFLASGCSKTLTCTNESKDNNSTQKSEVIIKFDGDKPTEMKTNIIFKTDSEETFNTYKKNFEKVLETMDIEGDISTGKNEITLTFSEKYNDDAKIIDGTNDYKNIREYFSNNGYTCR